MSGAVSTGASQAQNVLQSLSSGMTAWETFSLTSERENLDRTSEKIVQNQETSVTNRKALATATKGFKKTPEGEQLERFPMLLRQYQKEIDSLTMRARFAERSYLALYKTLADAPDPAVLLNLAKEEIERLEGMDALAMENTVLRRDLEAYEQEFRGLKNQDITIQRLEKRLVSFEEEMTTMVDTQLAAKQKELEREFEQKEMRWIEREQHALGQVAAMEVKLKAAQASRDTASSDLFQVTERDAKKQDALVHEIDMLNKQLTRARSRIAELEAQQTQGPLHDARVAVIGDGANEMSVADALALVSRLEMEITEKDVELAHHIGEIHSRDAVLEAARAEHAAALAHANDLIAAGRDRIAALESDLQHLPSAGKLEALERELAVLKGIEFGGASAGATDLGCDKDAPLESLLMAKNRALEAAHAQQETASKAQAARIAELEEALETAHATLDERDALVAQLEDDLLRSVGRGGGSAAGVGVHGSVAAAPGTPPEARQTASLAVQILSDATAAAESPRTASDSQAAGADGGGGDNGRPEAAHERGTMDILAAQRDRFKERVFELEGENQHLHDRVHALTSKVDSLKNDSLQLYEKIKYLESYDEIAKDRSAAAAASGGVTVLVDGRAESNVESRYRKIYEDSMNPFTLFHRRQRDTRYQELNAAEKVTLTTSRFLLGTKFARTFIFFYSVTLHVLVFAVLYKLSSAADCTEGRVLPQMRFVTTTPHTHSQTTSSVISAVVSSAVSPDEPQN